MQWHYLYLHVYLHLISAHIYSHIYVCICNLKWLRNSNFNQMPYEKKIVHNLFISEFSSCIHLKNILSVQYK